MAHSLVAISAESLRELRPFFSKPLITIKELLLIMRNSKRNSMPSYVDSSDEEYDEEANWAGGVSVSSFFLHKLTSFFFLL